VSDVGNNANLYARLAAGFEHEACLLELPDGSCYSYGDAERVSAQVANTLHSLGLRPGDRVAVVAEKSVSLLWLYLGCLRAGVIYQPLNSSYSERELAFFIGNAGARLVVHDPQLTARVLAACAQCSDLPQRLTLDASGGGELSMLWAGADTHFDTHRADSDTVAALLYSSGTTGTPKGIPITHDNLYSNAAALRETWAFVRNDVLLHALPFYHVHGLFITLHPAMLAGMRLRFHARFDADEVVAGLAGVTLFAGVPTYYTRLLATPSFGRAACASVRLFISGSAPLLESTFHEFAQRTGQIILERYGMTETGINTSNPLHGERRPGAVGLPLPGVAVRIVDEQGVSMSPGDIGEIEVRGPNVFRAYWRLPAQTAGAFSADGYFRTGDQGRFDDDGYLHIVGRSKDMIISGGLNVYPKEIESELDELQGVSESAVFGVPHPDFGEAVVAAVIVEGELDDAAVLKHLRTRLAGFKLPKRIVRVSELPRNTMGKVQKSRLRDSYATMFSDEPGKVN
jgi:malonyl-CoA/methylmalonyl-CoA synthetase